MAAILKKTFKPISVVLLIANGGPLMKAIIFLDRTVLRVGRGIQFLRDASEAVP